MKIFSKLIAVLVVLIIDKCFSSDIDDSTESLNETSTSASPATSTFYTAAVVEFHPKNDKFSDPQDIVEANLAEYISFIEKAGEKGVDIVVFSEASLNYEGINTRENLSQVAVDLQGTEIPDNSDCDYSHDSILSGISFAAANASIYVLVNVVEVEACNETDICLDGFKLFNSNLVFDRRGCVISRYRKFNLFVEPNMNVTESPEVETFETDFGVTFGHFVCFDILFKSPAMDLVGRNVKHILYPSMWFSETPFLTSVQIQQGFAEANNIVLLSAGTNSPGNSNTGSGIFIGRHGAVQRLISCQNESRMMIAEVPKDVDDPDYDPTEPDPETCTPSDMDALKLWRFKPEVHEILKEHFVSTSNEITCEFSVNFTKSEEETTAGYRFVVFSGSRSFAGLVSAGEVHCAIVACSDVNDLKTCGDKLEQLPVEFHSISVKMTVDNDKTDNYLVMPTTLESSLLPAKAENYYFHRKISDDKQKYEIRSTLKLENLLTFGIYGRNYASDTKKIKKNEENSSENSIENQDTRKNRSVESDDDNSFSLKMTIYVVLMVVLSIITAVMTYRKLQHPYVKPDLSKRRKSSMYVA